MAMEQKRNSELTHKQKFSSASRRYPGSPRNLIIQACCFRDHPDDIVYDCYCCLHERDIKENTK